MRRAISPRLAMMTEVIGVIEDDDEADEVVCDVLIGAVVERRRGTLRRGSRRRAFLRDRIV